jgi:hypothetical protein
MVVDLGEVQVLIGKDAQPIQRLFHIQLAALHPQKELFQMLTIYFLPPEVPEGTFMKK